MNQPPEEITLNPIHGLAVRAKVALADLPAFFGSAFHDLAEVARQAGAEPSGMPFARYHSVPPAAVDVEAIMPVRRPVSPSGRVHAVELPGGSALQLRHLGPYDDLHTAYAELTRAMVERGLQPTDVPREVYLTDPQGVPDSSKWETLVIQPTRAG